jgi:16S rRNA processing protein RimM
MAYKTGILLGIITKVNGFEGAVTVKLDRSCTENIPVTESVFLEIEGRPVPFFISTSEYSGAGTLKLKFEHYDSGDQVEEFVSARVFLTGSTAPVKRSREFKSLEGFNVFDQDDCLVGCITEVIQNPAQLLLNIISQDNREILIPLHENLIISIDKRKKEIIMDIPEGLTEIN